jgi:hypothetical protein
MVYMSARELNLVSLVRELGAEGTIARILKVMRDRGMSIGEREEHETPNDYTVRTVLYRLVDDGVLARLRIEGKEFFFTPLSIENQYAIIKNRKEECE